MLLQAGLFSRKLIAYYKDDDEFWVLNCIDDTEQLLSSEDIMDKGITNIGESIRLGSFWFVEHI